MEDPRCIFCKIVKGESPSFVVFENEKYLAFLDRFPKSKGHVQLIPKEHYRWIYDVPDMGELFALARKIIHGIIPVLGADHVTLASLGHQVHHAHIWIVPQYASGKGVKLEETEPNDGRAYDQQDLAKIMREAIAKEVFS